MTAVTLIGFILFVITFAALFLLVCYVCAKVCVELMEGDDIIA